MRYFIIKSHGKVNLKSQPNYITCTLVRRAGDYANQLGPCSISVTHLSDCLSLSLSLRGADQKVSRKALDILEHPLLSRHPPANFPFDRGPREAAGKRHAGLRRASILICGRVRKTLRRLCPLSEFTTEAEGAVAQGWGFEEGMKQARLRLETLSGIFHHSLSARGT